jgi:hypothetical protein
MTMAAVVKNTDFTRRRKKLNIEVTMSSNYATGGDTLNLTTMTNPNFLAGANVNSIPPQCDVAFKNGPGGYEPRWVPGTTLANGKVQIYSTGGTEVAAGAYPAALSGDKLEIEISSKMYSGM